MKLDQLIETHCRIWQTAWFHKDDIKTLILEYLKDKKEIREVLDELEKIEK